MNSTFAHANRRCFARFISCFLTSIFLISSNPTFGQVGEDFYERNDINQRLLHTYRLLEELTPFRSSFDVKHYDLAIDIDTENKSIQGVMTMTARVTQALDTIQLELLNTYTIHSILDLEDSSVRPFSRLNERSFLVDCNPRKIGQILKIQVRYSGKPPEAKDPPWHGGFVWGNRANKPDIAVACEGEGASIWWPLKDHLSDEPDSVTTHFTVDSGLYVVSNGRLISRVTRDARTTFTWSTSYPINSYNVTFYAGNYQKVEAPYTGYNGQKMTLEYFVMPNHVRKAKFHFKQVPEILRIFEGLFGPYPWYKDGFKLVESPYGGMEHQTAIAYGNDYKNDMFDGKMDYTLVHEIAHEWWGNSVSCGRMADIWLHEGFATYAESLYLERKYGRPEFFESVSWNKSDYDHQLPVVDHTMGRFFDSELRGNVYPHGALAIQALRSQIDDSLFFDILFSFCFTHHAHIVTTSKFILFVNEKTGQDFSWLFRQYLLQTKLPELKYYWKDKQLTYWWENTDDSFDQMTVSFMMRRKQYDLVPSREKKTLVIDKRGVMTFLDDAHYLHNGE